MSTVLQALDPRMISEHYLTRFCNSASAFMFFFRQNGSSG